MKPSRILIRLPNWIGDIVMSTGFIRECALAFPEAEVHLLGSNAAKTLLAGLPGARNFIEGEWRRGSRNLRTFRETVAKIRSMNFDAAFLLTNSFSTALTIFSAGVKERVGYQRDLRSFMLTRSMKRPTDEFRKFRPTFMGDFYLALLELLGVPRTDSRMELAITEDEDLRFRALLGSRGITDEDRIVTLNPGASFGRSKMWSEEGFAKVADFARSELGAKIVLLFGPGEDALAKSIESKMFAKPDVGSETFVPLDLLKPLLKRTNLLVTTDTGPRHVAAVFGTRTITLLGPTDSRYTENPQEKNTIVRSDHPCMPCHYKLCPIDHRCMTSIGADDVIEELRVKS
ncbi:MAG: lipopolysaccharide heptosyltransferase II [Planctomycetes bacterium]|nr:lipopolysaccharide heptosyltransferase II [Planctomycetota bacterium]